MRFFRKWNEARFSLAWGLIAIWTAFVAASLLWNLHESNENAFDLARTDARLSYEKDLAYRLWAANHGGVYVPITPQTPPNPYLSHIKEREIQTESGRLLTLINPAYMTRQVYELSASLYGSRGHLTSLKPIRPENAPDIWEQKALKTFETGVPEVIEIVSLDGEPYMRLMRPFVTEKSCLKCHQQGYKEGDIRGGISVSVPLKPYLAAVKKQTFPLAATYSLIWGLGLVGIILRELHIRRHLEERRQTEEALRERTTELEFANRELESFGYSVSHDLKAPIRAIQGFSRMIAREHTSLLDKEGHRLFNVIVDNTQIMANLIDDLLALSRVGRHQIRKSRIDIGVIARQVFERMQQQEAERDLQLNVEGLPPALGDPSLIKQVMINLVDNAIKYTKTRETPVIQVGGCIRDQETMFYVKDNGIGFDERYADKLFGVFQRLHTAQEYEGTGVGLAIVKRIIERHGGRVWAEGKVGEGATFYFTLPKNKG